MTFHALASLGALRANGLLAAAVYTRFPDGPKTARRAAVLGVRHRLDLGPLGVGDVIGWAVGVCRRLRAGVGEGLPRDHDSVLGGLGRSSHWTQNPGVAEHALHGRVAHLGSLSDVSQGGVVVHVHADHGSFQCLGVGLPSPCQTPHVPARPGHGRNVLHGENCSADGQLGLDKNVTRDYN